MLSPATPSHLRTRSLSRLVAAALVATLGVACTGDSASNDSMADTTGMGLAAEQFRAQKAISDSMFAVAKSTQTVAEELGPMYHVADDSLATLVRRENAKTWDCYTKAREEHDPYLVGVAHVLLNFGAAGWDIVRVEKSEFSSVFGGTVVSCLNMRAKDEWQLPVRGVPAGARLVSLRFHPDSAPR